MFKNMKHGVSVSFCKIYVMDWGQKVSWVLPRGPLWAEIASLILGLSFALDGHTCARVWLFRGSLAHRGFLTDTRLWCCRKMLGTWVLFLAAAFCTS